MTKVKKQRINFAKDDIKNLELKMEDLINLRNLVIEVKEYADALTMEGEFVGKTYDNLDYLDKIFNKDIKKGNSKIIQFKKPVSTAV